MKVILTNLPWFVGGKQGIRAGSRWPHFRAPEEENYLPFPFFLAYATNLLKKNKFDAHIIDAIAKNMSYEEFYKQIKKTNPKIIFIETSSPSLEHDLKIIKQIKTFSKAKIVLGGMHSFDKKFLEENKQIDSVIIGEYEFALLKLVKQFQKEKKIISFVKEELHENLDDFPWSYNDELPMKKYHDCPGCIPSPSVQMWASRGCPYNCSFCAWPQLMYKPRKYRTRSIKYIIDEIEFLKKKGFKSFYFDDDTFNVGKKRMLELCSEIKKRKINLPWAIMARADLMDKEILVTMKDAGLHALKYGVESSSQKLLDACNKQLDIKKAEENILLTKELGIKVHLTFTFGLPGETKKTIQKTVNFALKMNPESVQFSITTPFPGTKYYDELKSKNLLIEDTNKFDGNFKSIIKNKHFSSEYLEQAVRDAYKVWHKHKIKRELYTNKKSIQLFKECIKEHGLSYTLKKTANYLIKKNHKKYKPKKKILQEIKTKNKTFIGPEYVTIDLTNKCNLNCIACWTYSPLLKNKKPEKEWFRQELSYQTIEKLICELYKTGTKEIRITGGGEPFLHKDIFRIIELIKSKGMRCDLTTNFTLLNKDKIQQLAKLNIENLTISIWAGDKETYKQVHPKQKAELFDKVKKNLILLNKLKMNTTVVLANVISNLNYKNVNQMVKFSEKVQADEVYFTFVDPIKGATDKLLLNEKERKKLHQTLLKLKKRKNKVKIDSVNNIIRRISNPKAIEGYYDSNMKSGMKCYVGWSFARIMANGDVAPCCRANNNITGNLNKQSFNEIWNGTLQKKFRNNGLKMHKKFTDKIGCYMTCDNWWHNEQLIKKS